MITRRKAIVIGCCLAVLGIVCFTAAVGLSNASAISSASTAPAAVVADAPQPRKTQLAPPDDRITVRSEFQREYLNAIRCNDSATVDRIARANIAEPIPVDVVFELIDPDQLDWAQRLSTYKKLVKALSDGDAAEMDDMVPTRPLWDVFRLSLRSFFKNVLCSSGDCCGRRSGLRVASIVLLVPWEHHVPPWLAPNKIKVCMPSIKIVTHPAAIAALRLPLRAAAPLVNTVNPHAIHAMLGNVPGSYATHILFIPHNAIFTRPVLWSDFFAFANATTLYPRFSFGPVLEAERDAAVTPEVIRASVVPTAAMGRESGGGQKPPLSLLDRQREYTENVLNHALGPQGAEFWPPTGPFSWRADSNYTRSVAIHPLIVGVQVISRAHFAASAVADTIKATTRRKPTPLDPAMVLPMHAYIKEMLVMRARYGPLPVAPAATETPSLTCPQNVFAHNLAVAFRYRSVDELERVVTTWLLPSTGSTASSDVAPFVTILNHLPLSAMSEAVDVRLESLVSRLVGGRSAQLGAAFASERPLWEISDGDIAIGDEEPLEQRDPATGWLWVIEKNVPDDSSFHAFPCGAAHARVDTGYLPSPGVVSDLVEVPDADALEIANRTCWFPSFDTALRERLNKDFADPVIAPADVNATDPPPRRKPLVTMDVVYTYVRGDAPVWYAKLRETEEQLGIPHVANRIRDWDELRYSLRSVHHNLCPRGDCCGITSGLRIATVYIVMATVEHIPSWLANFTIGPRSEDVALELNDTEIAAGCPPQLRIITHDMVYPGAGNNPEIGEFARNETMLAQYLPTFNSNGIESCLHRIPHIQRHFIYLNNDFMFGRPVHVTDFFRPVVLSEQSWIADIHNRSTLNVRLEPLIFAEATHGDMVWIGCVRTPRIPNKTARVPLGNKAACRYYPRRPGYDEQLKCRFKQNVNEWVKTEYFNVRLAFDRLDGLIPRSDFAHVPRVFEKNVLFKMIERDFGDVTETTRRSKARATNNLLVEFMYMFYAVAHRKVRNSQGDHNLCRRAPPLNTDNSQNLLYNVWASFEYFNLLNLDGKLKFLQVESRDQARDFAAQYRDGRLPQTTFVAVNDNLPGSMSEEEVKDTLAAFRELLNEMVAHSPPSPWE